ncbi:MAG: hypothetical protein KGO92_07615 [Bacteroidota bacterium]|nr:hypothetical protein [Bacteroidota bacterium]
MYLLKSGFIFLLFCFVGNQARAQKKYPRFDTSIKVGKVGYRVSCNNKNPERNIANISPIGFDKSIRDFSFEIKGRIHKAEVDDLNRDGYPDLVFYIFNNDSIPKGNVVAISSEKNENVAPILFPDIYDDPKLRIGYKGDDEFFLLEGSLMRRFPVFPVEGSDTSATKEPGTLMRQIQYTVVPGERGSSTFRILRSFEYQKQ